MDDETGTALVDGTSQSVESAAGTAGTAGTAPTAESSPSGTANPAATQSASWTDSLPESLRAVAGGAKDMAGLEAALKHGLAHSPIQRAEDVEIPLPEGVEESAANLGWFRDVAVKQGFSKGQIKALTEAYNQEVTAAPGRLNAEAEKVLKAEYGAEYDAKIARANDAARKFDRMCGGTDEKPGALRKVLNMGLGNHPDFIRAMVMIGEAVSDSAMPGYSTGSGGVEAVSTEEFLNSVMGGK